MDSHGLVCIPDPSKTPTDVTSEPSSDDFTTNALCHSTGLLLTKGGTYRLRITIPETRPWIDKEIPAGPYGVHPDCVTFPMTAAVPLRRRLTEPWFKPMARIGTTGNDDYALTPKPSLPEPKIRACTEMELPPLPGDVSFESEIIARSEGELFLYVNDAVFPPYLNHWLYDNNRGSARVTVKLVPTPPS